MKQLCLFFFFLTLSLQAQFQVNGIVKEAVTNKPLPFATITTNNGLNSISDVDGKFSIITVIPFTVLIFLILVSPKLGLSSRKTKIIMLSFFPKRQHI